MRFNGKRIMKPIVLLPLSHKLVGCHATFLQIQVNHATCGGTRFFSVTNCDHKLQLSPYLYTLPNPISTFLDAIREMGS